MLFEFALLALDCGSGVRGGKDVAFIHTYSISIFEREKGEWWWVWR
jgi:hypothetical protein